MAENPYQLYLYVGPAAPKLPGGVSLVNLTPAEATSESVVAALEASGLTAADLRTRALFLLDPAAGPSALLVYAAICGFSSRLIDFSDFESVFNAHTVHQALAHSADAGRPEDAADAVQVGEPHADTDRVVNLEILGELSEDDLSTLRYARRALLHLGERTLSKSFELFVVLASLRARKNSDRFPTLVSGDIDLDAEQLEGIDLDQLRRAGAEMRRSKRVDDRSIVVDRVEQTPRALHLVAAAALPVEDVLVRLGAHQDAESGFWRCPRPDRHKNGDANPSSRVEDNTLRCFRCDVEAVDPLRLVMDCLGVSPDDAADWLLAVVPAA